MESDRQLFLVKARALLACYTTSGAGSLLAIVLMRDVVTVDQSRLLTTFLPAAGILCFTGFAQWWFNERAFAPIVACLRGQAPPREGGGNQGLKRRIAFLYLVTAVAPLVIVGVHTGWRGQGIFAIAKILGILSIVGMVGAAFLWFLVSRSASASLAAQATPAEALQAALAFPMRSALASLALWTFSTLTIPLLFHFVAGYSVRTSIYFALLICGAALIAFPVQYFLFKREISPLVSRLLDLDPESLTYQRISVPFRFKFFFSTLGLVLCGMGIATVRSFAGIEQILLDTTAAASKARMAAWQERIQSEEGADPASWGEALQEAGLSWVDAAGAAHGSREPWSPGGPSPGQVAEKLPPSGELSMPFQSGWVEGRLLARRVGPGVLVAAVYPNTEILSRLLWPSIETLAVVLMIGLLLAVFFARDVSATLQALGDYTQDLAQGVLTGTLRAASDDEHGDLSRLLRTTAERLEELLLQVKSLADHVAQAAAQLSVHSSDLSQGATTQDTQAQAARQRITLMVEILGEQGQGAAESLKQADQMREAAVIGAQAVQVSVKGMHQIQTVAGESKRRVEDLATHAAQIRKITETIVEIAAQTNMLALNASIEAARAGEHGRGFGIVAEEIRKLAESASGAAQEIDKVLSLIGAETQSALDANRR